MCAVPMPALVRAVLVDVPACHATVSPPMLAIVSALPMGSPACSKVVSAGLHVLGTSYVEASEEVEEPGTKL